MIAGLLLLAAGASIPDERYGDWSVTTLGTGSTIASVKNNADSAFGVICLEDFCTSFFNPALKCDEGTKYPALVNAPSSAFPVTMECVKAGGLDFYTFPMDDGVKDALSIGGVIGIAYPMQSGEFKVARFSLTGSARASARASQIAKHLKSSGNRKGSDSSTL